MTIANAVEIVPYCSVGRMWFGQSTMGDCRESLGEPQRVRLTSEGAFELEYKHSIIRFDQRTQTVKEVTMLPYATAIINGICVTWDLPFLRSACKADGDPRNICGFIVLKNLGIAVTGIHDSDEPQLAITAYSRGALNDLLPESKPFAC